MSFESTLFFKKYNSFNYVNIILNNNCIKKLTRKIPEHWCDLLQMATQVILNFSPLYKTN